MKTISLLIIFLLALTITSYAQEVIPLYSGAIPNSTGYFTKETIAHGTKEKPLVFGKISIPTMTVYPAVKEKSNGSAVIIFSGGAYELVYAVPEGVHAAEEFAKNGVMAFVVKYRIPSDSTMNDKTMGPLEDAQQAIKIVRMRAKEWNLDTSQIGIMGFSAGGHLASTAATHYNKSYISNKENINLRPDFLMLVYPVISMSDSLTHKGSRTNLLGKNPTAEQIKFFSNELQVTEQTPPTWLTHTTDDQLVDVDNSIAFYESLRHHHVPAEMHLIEKGDHGFVTRIPPKEWMQTLFDWMKKNRWMKV